MHIYKTMAVLCIIFTAVYCGCDGVPILTELKTNRIKVIVKGTYESNSPKNWNWPSNLADLADDSINLYPVNSLSHPNEFMMDITGISLTSDSKTSRFGNYRKTFSCSTEDENHPFFNGTGITMRNDDTDRNRLYTGVALYIRKMLFSHAHQYKLTENGWIDSGYYRTYFDEKKTDAYNFNLPLVHYLYDDFRDGDINRVYPIHINISNGLIFTGEENLVLEVRFVIKNFVKLYEYNRLDYTSDEPYIIHYFGVSDWLRDVQLGENTIGGNLLAVARTYVEGKTGSATGSIGATGYVIGISSDADINDYTMPNLNSDATLRKNKLKYADTTTEPPAAADNMPTILTYYTQLERYGIKRNEFFKRVKDNAATAYADKGVTEPQALFEYEWTEYNNAAENFKIAPLAVYTTDATGSFKIENIAPGDYKFYYTTDVPKPGELFKHNSFQPLKSSGIDTVTVKENETVNLDK